MPAAILCGLRAPAPSGGQQNRALAPAARPCWPCRPAARRTIARGPSPPAGAGSGGGGSAGGGGGSGGGSDGGADGSSGDGLGPVGALLLPALLVSSQGAHRWLGCCQAPAPDSPNCPPGPHPLPPPSSPAPRCQSKLSNLLLVGAAAIYAAGIVPLTWSAAASMTRVECDMKRALQQLTEIEQSLDLLLERQQKQIKLQAAIDVTSTASIVFAVAAYFTAPSRRG